MDVEPRQSACRARLATVPAASRAKAHLAAGVGCIMQRYLKTSRARILGGVAGAVVMAAASQGQALTIVPYFDSSITSDPNAAQIEATINNAISFYHAFSNPVTVNIIYAQAAVGLGANESTLYGGNQPSGGIAYGDYVSLLQADSAANPQNTVLQTALANLGSGNQLDILAPSANLRALGQDTPGAFGTDGSFGAGGTYDAIVYLDPTAGINYGATPVPGEYDATPVIQHETDEVLGTGGSGSMLGSGFPDDLMGVEDLYRYSGYHTPSFTEDPTANAYFSIDGGATDIMNFNQNGLGDYADWAKTTCEGDQNHVQDWAGCPYPLDAPVHLTLASPEVVALQAVGWDLRPGGGIPEPAAWALMVGGFATAGAMLRRRRALLSAA